MPTLADICGCTPHLAGTCAVCVLARTSPAHAALWGAPVPAVTRSLPCVHEGAVVSSCTACGGVAEGRHVRQCGHPAGVRDTCTRVSQGGGAQGCDRCPEYDAPDPFDPDRGRRHLLYHLLPVGGNGVWRRGVEQLAARWPLFTGRKVVAVCTGGWGGWLDPADAVRAALPPDAEVIEVANHPDRREVATWGPLWDRLRGDIGPHDSVLYAHAKGVTRNVDPGNSCQWWASLLYSLSLDHWPRTAELLRRHPLVGSLKKVGHGFEGVPSAWHYSGTFFWLRAAEALGRMARHPVPEFWWGVEAWPGVAYSPDEAGCLFLEGAVPALDLYSPEFWRDAVRPAYSRWRPDHPPQFPWGRP